jgi:hypothetical protein
LGYVGSKDIMRETLRERGKKKRARREKEIRYFAEANPDVLSQLKVI